MKKILYIIILSVVAFFYNPLVSKAESFGTVYLKSNIDIVEVGDEIEITLGIRGQKTASYLANIYFDEAKFEFLYGSENIIQEGNKVKVLWYDSQGGRRSKNRKFGKYCF